MDNPVPLSRRIAILAGTFFFILFSGVASMHLLGGATGDLAKDFYQVLILFGLEGGWVFDQPSNLYMKALAFIAPLFTILGIIELFTRKVVARGLQIWKLLRIRDHVVIMGLTEESLLLIQSLRTGKNRKEAIVIENRPEPGLAAGCRKLGVPVIEGDPASEEALTKAKLKDASIAVSFICNTGKAISLVFSVDALMRKHTGKSLDLWLNFEEPEFGRRLGDYLKFASLSQDVHPRFFNLNEVAARRLVRRYPMDVYADALRQDRLHLAVYGFDSFAFEVIEEILLQTSGSFSKRPMVTLLSENPESDHARLLAYSPQINTVADIQLQPLNVYSTGIASQDYKAIPENVTAHLVCHQKAEIAAAVSLSLRSLLLMPPAGLTGLGQRRLNAPIFVRLSRSEGIAQLLESHKIDPRVARKEGRERGDIPDGIFAFGMIEDLLGVDQDDCLIPTVIDTSREQAAKYLHFSYLYDLETLSKMFVGKFEGSDEVTRNWETLGPQFRESCRQEADHIWAKARLIRYRLFARTNGEETVADLTETEKKRIAVAEHQRWLTERRLAGWSFDKKRVDEAKRHNLLKPWEELSETEARLDLKLAERISAAAGHAGLVLKKELVIGVVGHRLSPDRTFDEAHVAKELKKTISTLLEKYPDRAPVILTHLADGADTIAAEVALDMGIPFVVPLPLPFETYRRDFDDSGSEHAEKFLDMIGLADLYFELPLKFGDLVDMAKEKKNGEMSEARKKQYALGGAFIVERADELIAVWDGKKARGTGGTADVVSWCQQGAVPKELQSPDHFKKHTKIKPAIVISPIRQ